MKTDKEEVYKFFDEAIEKVPQHIKDKITKQIELINEIGELRELLNNYHEYVATEHVSNLQKISELEEEVKRLKSQPLHPVKSLQECKDEVAKKHDLDSYFDANVYNRANELADEVAELYASQFKTPPVQEDQDKLWTDVLRGTKKGSMEDIIENWKSKYTIIPKQ